MGKPQRIQVIRKGPTAHVLVDGTELPFALPREAVTVPVHPDEVPSVRLTLFAERVDVVNQLATEQKETDR